MKLDINKITALIDSIHNGNVILDVSTYVSTKIKARFVDKEFGEWWAKPAKIIYVKQGHPKRGLLKLKLSIEELNLHRIYDAGQRLYRKTL